MTDDELGTVHERPLSEQAKNRLNTADIAIMNGRDVTLDADDNLKITTNQTSSNGFELDDDRLDKARGDVETVNALLNGETDE